MWWFVSFEIESVYLYLKMSHVSVVVLKSLHKTSIYIPITAVPLRTHKNQEGDSDSNSQNSLEVPIDGIGILWSCVLLPMVLMVST